ncbi:MAG TPA: hypothetical protein VN541_19805 [Tepidisphaeraceae bacterium]|nr:hypothetical protein [Tepidisphaeraceae bacterium]
MTARVFSLGGNALPVVAAFSITGALVRGATVTVQQAPVVEESTVLSGSPPPSTSYVAQVYNGSQGEERVEYEFPLPALPDGSAITGATFKTYIGQFQSQSSPAIYPNVAINGYAGDGVYSASDATVGLNPLGQTGSITAGGYANYALSAPYVQGLYGSTTHLGLMLSAQVQNFAAGFVRSGNYANIPSLSVTATVPDVGTVHAKPLFDALASPASGGTAFVVSDSDTQVNTQYFPPYVDRRGLLGFDLGAIPKGATITSASISFDVNTITSDSQGDNPQPRIYGYAGGAAASVTGAADLTDLLGTSDPVTALGPTTVNLDPAAVQSLLAGNDYLGITVLGSVNGEQFAYYTTEFSFADAPTLNVGYSVPEPASGLAVFAGAALLLAPRRRRTGARTRA